MCIIFFSAGCLLSFKGLCQELSSKFDYAKYEFFGTPVEQAKFLLRGNFMGKVDSFNAILPPALELLPGNQCNIERNKLRHYLKDHNINEKEVGGSINNPLSYILLNGTKKYATYFVIHDVSSPCYKDAFPGNINSASWKYNNLAVHKDTVCHLYVSRTGASKTMVEYSKGWRATKFETKVLGVWSRGLFLHIELIQPRVYPPGDCKTAPIGPEPGFTSEQYDRLALLYIVASVRKGSWLIPAFHACIDEGMADGHDDPQKFELEKFADSIDKLIGAIGSIAQ